LEKLFNEQRHNAQDRKQYGENDCEVMQAQGDASLGAVDIAFAAEYCGQAAFPLLKQYGDDYDDINAD
jgi:hypothetical protein